MNVIIVGGGAAGIIAAIYSAKNGNKVTLLERNNKPLKKLKVSGNGRANILNSKNLLYYGDESFANEVLKSTSYKDLYDFFMSIGVALRQDEEGRVYPAALHSSVVVEALLFECNRLGVEICTSTLVTNIAKRDNLFHVDVTFSPPSDKLNKSKEITKSINSEKLHYICDKVIVTTGGKASPMHGTDGQGYELLTALGHELLPTKPALCAFLASKKQLEGLSGQRVKANVSIASPNGDILHSTSGEVLFGNDYISGISTMQLARFYSPNCYLILDISPSLGDVIDQNNTKLSIQKWLESLYLARKECTIEQLMLGSFCVPIIKYILKNAKINNINNKVFTLTKNDMLSIANSITNTTLRLTSTRGWQQAQVTAGGIDTKNFYPSTLESKLCPGLFVAGEILNVDGDCGGYNLMFAFASGANAGKS